MKNVHSYKECLKYSLNGLQLTDAKPKVSSWERMDESLTTRKIIDKTITLSAFHFMALCFLHIVFPFPFFQYSFSLHSCKEIENEIINIFCILFFLFNSIDLCRYQTSRLNAHRQGFRSDVKNFLIYGR